MAACWFVSPGPRLAASDDDLVPVKLRRGGRTLGGSLSWDKPQPLASFSREGPFNAMPVPGDVTVNRQVLAEPEAGISERTWAALADGTPLVTGAKRGKGLVILFHVTADTRWSDLPLSGAFVDMLKRVVALAGTGVNAEQASAERVRETLVARPRARRLRRLHRAASHDPAGACQLQCACVRRLSARILRASGRTPRREHIDAARPDESARSLPAQRAARRLSPERAARSARADLRDRARACC